MNVVISGSRTIDSQNDVNKILDDNKEDVSLLIEGGARGVDSLARQWAIDNNVPFKTCPAEWRTKDGVFRRNAGYIRNAEMIEEGDMVIAIWDGKSKGTKHAIDIGTSEGKEVRKYVRTVVYKREIING